MSVGFKVPDIGRWYRNASGALFEVVAVDAADGTIEIQHFDGTIEELDPESWIATQPLQTTPPEDWSGSVDVTAEDLPNARSPVSVDWHNEIDWLEVDGFEADGLEDVLDLPGEDGAFN